MTTSTELVSIDAKINLDDVVSVRVAEVELKLDQNVDKQRALVKAKREVLNAAKEKLNKLVREDAETYLKAQCATVTTALKAFGPKIVAVPTKDRNAVISDKGEIFSYVEIQIEKSRHASFPVEIPVTKRVKAALEEIKTLEKEASEANQGLLILMEGKAKIPVYERVCRAKVAENRLSKTVEGREILTKLRSEDVNNVLSLPTGTL